MLENYSQELQKTLKKENITAGQKISIKNGNTRYDGFLMPKSAGDPNIIVLKLANGYNIGLAFTPGMKIRKQQDKRTLEKRKTGSGKYKPDPGKPTITLLHTGGTFASRVDYKTGAAYPAFTPEELFFAIPEAGKIANFNTRVVFQMFSEDMEPEHWILLAKKIAQEIYGLKGIIAPGVMVTGFISATLAAEIPGAQVRRMNLKFIHPVYAPSLHIVVQYEVTEQKRNVAKVLVTIMNGDEKTAEGYCILLLP